MPGTVEIADIKDRESLEAWLDDQPREVSAWIVSRGAARVLPVWWQAVQTKDWARKDDLTALPVLRSLLISSVAAKMPTEEMKAATAATAAADAVAADFWDIVRADAAQVSDGDIPWVVKLWGIAPNPFAGMWQEVKARVQTSDTAGDWQFWIDWCQALLDGRPMLGDEARTWEMLEKIALIDPEVWDQGPEVVNPLIAGIWTGYGSKRLKSNLNAFRELLDAIDSTDELKNRVALLVADELSRNSDAMQKSKEDLFHTNALVAQVRQELEKVRAQVFSEKEEFDNLKKQARDTRALVDSWMADLQKKFDDKITAAEEALNQQNVFKSPIELWKKKEEEHETRKNSAYWQFIGSLIGLAVFVVVGIGAAFKWHDALAAFATLPGCNGESPPANCNAFSFFGFLPLAAIFTRVTLLLWFSRLKMKEYLSERHLMIDARERQAFAEAYIRLLATGESGEEMKDHRAIVYSALFRPSTEGMVKDDGGLDPSIAAAISKFLSR